MVFLDSVVHVSFASVEKCAKHVNHHRQNASAPQRQLSHVFRTVAPHSRRRRIATLLQAHLLLAHASNSKTNRHTRVGRGGACQRLFTRCIQILCVCLNVAQ